MTSPQPQQVGCRSCDLQLSLPPHDEGRLQLLAFFDEHEGHQVWVDLTERSPVRPAAAD